LAREASDTRNQQHRDSVRLFSAGAKSQQSLSKVSATPQQSLRCRYNQSRAARKIVRRCECRRWFAGERQWASDQPRPVHCVHCPSRLLNLSRATTNTVSEPLTAPDRTSQHLLAPCQHGRSVTNANPNSKALHQSTAAFGSQNVGKASMARCLFDSSERLHCSRPVCWSQCLLADGLRKGGIICFKVRVNGADCMSVASPSPPLRIQRAYSCF
jgi:hypothetical protein